MAVYIVLDNRLANVSDSLNICISLSVPRHDAELVVRRDCFVHTP